MLPGLILVGFLQGLLPKPWNVIGVGLTAGLWTPTLILGDSLSIGNRDAVAGATALAFANAFVGMIVAVRFRGIFLRAVRAA